LYSNYFSFHFLFQEIIANNEVSTELSRRVTLKVFRHFSYKSLNVIALEENSQVALKPHRFHN